jgi:fructoselysine-6-P-deglycase FrlB-like protein
MLSELDAEIQRQPGILEAFAKVKSTRAPPGSLFVGAGDSYAASYTANYLASMKYTHLNPYELLSAPGLARGRNVYFVSMSGRTASNLAATRAIRHLARSTTAVTANPEGRLSEVTDRTVLLPYQVVPRLPGMLSFSLSLLALLKLAGVPLVCDFEKVNLQARQDSKKLLFSKSGVTHFLGNGPAFPVCQYAALKSYEIFGRDARASLLEEFCHAGVFSLDGTNVVNAFQAFDPVRLVARLSVALGENGYEAVSVPAFGSNPIEQTLHAIFLSQFALINRAKSDGRSRPYLAGARRKLAISDSTIY